MNRKQMLQRKEIYNDLKHTSHRGCFIYHKANSEAHEEMKFKVFKWAKEEGYEVLVEARFNDGKRADIVIVDLGLIIEIETDQDPKNIIKKKETYQYRWLNDVIVLDPSKPFNAFDLA